MWIVGLVNWQLDFSRLKKLQINEENFISIKWL